SGGLLGEAEALAPVFAIGDARAPLSVIEVPAHRLPDALLEGVRRGPAELTLDLGGVDGIAPVVPRPVLHEGDEPPARSLWRGRHLVEQVAERVDDVQVGPLAPAADVVRLPRLPAQEHRAERLAVIAHVEPVAHVEAVAVDGERFALERVQD